MKKVIKELLTPKDKKIKFCSTCGSANLKVVTNPGLVGVAAFAYYHCNSCQLDMLPLEGDEKFIKEFRKKLKKRR